MRLDPSNTATRKLSPREREILSMLSRGMTNREIAAALCREPSTVAWLVARMKSKLGIPRRTALAAFGVKMGLA